MIGPLEQPRGARFSPCQGYRYELWRQFDASRPWWIALMLNPSTADEVDNDHTVERQERRARAAGYGGLFVLNIFAFRSTAPELLYTQRDPIGPDNDATILRVCREPNALVVCGWGKHGNLNARGYDVWRTLTLAGVKLHCLEMNKDGTPKHPLYVAYKHQPTPYVP